MKSPLFPLLAALAGPVLLMTSVSAQTAKEDLTQVYEKARNAFNRGDLATAKTGFARLLKVDPNFELGKIYMAQIRYAEAQWEARPRPLKIVEKATMGTVAFREIPLSEALELVRHEIEKAGTGANAGPIELHTDLSAEMLAQPVSLSVKDVPMQWWIDSVAYAGGVRISLEQKGLSVTAGLQQTDLTDKAAVAAIRQMRQRAQDQILARVAMDKASLPEALTWLRQRTDPSKGPLIVARSGLPPATVTLDLRNIPLSEAIRSIAIIADLDVDWCSWGAGLRPKSVPGPVPAPVPVPTKAAEIRATL